MLESMRIVIYVLIILVLIISSAFSCMQSRKIAITPPLVESHCPINIKNPDHIVHVPVLQKSVKYSFVNKQCFSLYKILLYKDKHVAITEILPIYYRIRFYANKYIDQKLSGVIYNKDYLKQGQVCALQRAVEEYNNKFFKSKNNNTTISHTLKACPEFLLHAAKKSIDEYAVTNDIYLYFTKYPENEKVVVFMVRDRLVDVVDQ